MMLCRTLYNKQKKYKLISYNRHSPYNYNLYGLTFINIIIMTCQLPFTLVCGFRIEFSIPLNCDSGISEIASSSAASSFIGHGDPPPVCF